METKTATPATPAQTTTAPSGTTALVAQTVAPAPVPLNQEHLSSWDKRMKLAEVLAKSLLIPTPLRGKPADVMIILLTAEELGIGYMLALRTIFVLDGKPSYAAGLIAALVLRSPVCEEFRVIESTEKVCVIRARRRGSKEASLYSFTIEDAQRAKLTSKDNWSKYPKSMLMARTQTMAARGEFPDVAAGLYDPDELGAEVVSGQVVSSETVAEAAMAQPPEFSEEQRAEIEEHKKLFTEAIAAATSREGLKTMVEPIKIASEKYPEIDTAVRPLFEARWRELKDAAAQATAATAPAGEAGACEACGRVGSHVDGCPNGAGS